MRNRLRIRLILKELHVKGFFLSAIRLFLQPYECSEGFEACCPHFQQTMQLHEQRMQLKLSMQSNKRQWGLHITQNTIEAHVHPHKYYVHVCACTHKYMHALIAIHTLPVFTHMQTVLPKPLFLTQRKLSNQ